MATIEIRDLLNETGETVFPRTHVNAVIGLDDYIFFEVYTDGNGVKSVRLKQGYAGLWADGWIAAGGVGSGGGGGGGASYLSDLNDVTTSNPSNGQVLMYDTTLETPQWVNKNPSAIASLTNGVSYSTLTVNGATADIYTKGQVDTLIGAMNQFSYEVVSTLPTAGLSTMYKIYLVPSSDPQTQNIKDEYITIYDNSTYKWEQIGSTAIDLSGYVPTSRKVNGHALTTDVTVTASDVGLGNVSNLAASDYFTAMTMDGDDLSLTIGGTTKKYTVGYATTAIQTRFTPSETGATQITPLLDWFVPETYTEDNTTKYRLRLNPKYAGMYADGWVAAGGVGSASSGGGSLETLTDVELTSLATNDLLRYNGTKWVNVSQSSIMPTLSVVVPSTGNALTGVTYSNGTFTFATGTFLTSVPDLSSTYLSLANGGTVQDNVVFNEYIEGPNSVWYIGDDGVCKFSDIEYINSIRLHGLLDGGTLSGDTFTQKWSITNAGAASFASLTVGGSSVLTGVNMNGSNVTVTDGIANIGTVITSHQTVSNNAATLSAGQTVTIATIGSTNITVTVPSFALASALSNYVPTTRTINGVDLSVNRTFYIGTSQVQSSSQAQAIEGISSIKLSSADSLFSWDPQNHAWHFAGNMYADGWIAAGGIGEDGGGGYGVEEITTNQDGTVDFHFTGGDVTTVDLNHEHPQYPKYVVCTQAEYDALTTKDSDTLYLIPATT